MRHHLELETEALIARGMNPAEAARRRAPPLRQRRAGQGRLPRFVGPAGDRHAVRQDVRYAAALAAQVSRLHRGRPAHPRPRHRREHRDLQRRACRAAAAAAVHARRSPGRSAPAGAADRRRQRRRVGRRRSNDYRAQTASLDAIVEYHQMSFNLLGRGEAVARADRRRLGRSSSTCSASRRCSAARSAPTTIRRMRRRCWSSATPTGRTRSAAIPASSAARSR